MKNKSSANHNALTRKKRESDAEIAARELAKIIMDAWDEQGLSIAQRKQRMKKARERIDIARLKPPRKAQAIRRREGK